MIHKYSRLEIIGIYLGIAVFLTFILAPFLEAFLVSLRPLNQINSVPYKIITENMSLMPTSPCGTTCQSFGFTCGTASLLQRA